LEIWLGSKDHAKDTVHRIQQEIRSVLTVLKRKKITDKHVEYIINRVLIPRIEYRTQYCTLNPNIAHTLTAQLQIVMKQIAKISKTISNSSIHHKSLYRLKSINEIQRENQIPSFTNMINSNGHPSYSTIIRLKQAQIQQWEPANILTEKTIQRQSKKNLSAAILKMANNMGITYPNSHWTNTFQWTGGFLSVKTLLDNQVMYNQSIKSIRKHNIMYIDQIIEKETGILLNWKFIQSTSSHGRGPKPSWYIKIQETIANESGVLKANWANMNWTTQNREYFPLYATQMQENGAGRYPGMMKMSLFGIDAKDLPIHIATKQKDTKSQVQAQE